MSQVQIKQIIGSFSKLLDSFKFTTVTPEQMRQAKFNKNEVVKVMWNLLYELIYYINGSTCSNQNTSKNIYEYTKEEMIKLGYTAKDFLNLSCNRDGTNEPEENSSREVLIAIGWLISTYDIVEMFANEILSICNEEYFNEKSLKFMEINTSECTKEVESMKLNFKQNNRDDMSRDQAHLNYIKLINGRFKSKLNSYYACLMEKASLTHKLHIKSLSNDANGNDTNLSCLDLYLLRNVNEMKKFEKLLEEKKEMQENLLFWLENEELFWKWMETVIDEKLANDENKTGGDDTYNETLSLVKLALNEGLKDFRISKQEFENQLEKLHEYQRQVKAECSFTDEEFEDYAMNNYETITKMEEKNQLKFDLILNTNNLLETKSSQSTNSIRQIKSKILDEVFPTRLKLLNKSKSKSRANTIRKLTSDLELRHLYLKSVLDEYKNESVKKCEDLAAKLKDCYVVYSD